MKWPLVVMLAAGAAVGCRSSQPAANPFIRTTVPPPGTGSAAVVVPGEQYYPTGSPPPGPPGAVAAPAPVVSPGPPPVMAPPPGAPPVVIPPKDKYAPPGGSFQYNQSSKEQATPGAAGAAAGAALASMVAEPTPTQEDRQAAENPSDAVREAVAMAVEPDETVPATFDDERDVSAREAIAADMRKGPPEALAVDDADPRVADDVARLMRGSVAEVDEEVAERAAREESEAAEEPAAPTGRVVRQPTPREPAATQTAALDAVSPEPAAEDAPVSEDAAVGEGQEQGVSAPTRIKLVATGPVRAAPGAVESPTQDAVEHVDNEAPAADASASSARSSTDGTATAQSMNGSSATDYAFTKDYGALRGRLEYSQSLRQWKLRYIPIDGATDSYGGSVVLNDSQALARFQPGDRVAVRGALAGKATSGGSFSPLYQLQAIEPITR